MENSLIDIYDLEQFPNMHSYAGIDKDSGRRSVFIIHSSRNDLPEYLEYLDKLKGLIGYNNLSYDYPLIHFILTNKDKLLRLDADGVNKLLYEKSQDIISSRFSSIRPKNVIIPQLDVFKIHHYDNMARSTSLKWLQFSLRWEKMQDLPFHWTHIVQDEDIDTLIKYNFNDVESTRDVFNKSQKEIAFRRNTTRKLGQNVMNHSDVKIGELMNQLSYEKLSKRSFWDFRKDRTYRKYIKLSDVIEKKVTFKTPYLQAFLDDLKTKEFKEGSKAKTIDKVLKIGGNSFKFAKGGLHSEDEPRIVQVKPGHILKEKDVASYYPASIVESQLFPKHLGVEWYHGIKDGFDRRNVVLKPLMSKLKKEGKKNDQEYIDADTEQAVIKLSLNGGAFGKLGSEYSWQYDPLQKYKITINCELKLLILIEEFDLAGIQIHSANTDGVVIEYREDQEEIVQKIHDDWEERFGYILEDTNYNKIVFNSVNDYIAEIIDPKTKERQYLKFKGDFEIDKDWHKNNSQRIVPIALKEYFINGVPIKDTIRNIGFKFENTEGKSEQTSIYDYCIGVKKAKGQTYHWVKQGETVEINDKVIRYYIDNSNNKLFKEYVEKKRKAKGNEITLFEVTADGKKLEAVSKGFNAQLFMDYEDKEDFNLNYSYYEQECMKIIKPIEINTKKFSVGKLVQTFIT